MSFFFLRDKAELGAISTIVLGRIRASRQSENKRPYCDTNVLRMSIGVSRMEFSRWGKRLVMRLACAVNLTVPLQNRPIMALGTPNSSLVYVTYVVGVLGCRVGGSH